MEALLGVVLILLGGFSNGSFYMPYKKISTWSWEVFWIVGGIISWVLAPWIFSFATVPNLFNIFSSLSFNDMFKPFIFGVFWGIGSLTFGLSMRYLGISLGMAIALGLTLVFGALIPSVLVYFLPGLFPGAVSLGTLFSTASGIVTLLGIGLCIVGIIINGKAGLMKDKQLTSAQKQDGVSEFNVKKGISVAVFSGFMSSAFAMGVAAGKPISELAKANGANPVFENNPSFILIMFGGFLVNLVWCVRLQMKNKTFSDIKKSPVGRNVLLCVVGGTLWYLQMFFYGMGESILKGVAGWSILMTSSILFSTMWGLLSKEWKGVQKNTSTVLAVGLAVLILSTIVFGIAKALAV
jgi:L-rhamnose-H+ transport protein